MSTARFDELIDAPTRLEIVSLLAAAQWAALESAGYVEIRYQVTAGCRCRAGHRG